ncbi:SusD/RagB family nutrient-binding outer membrane lipoprotein [Rapidithrix thailandica]|uniref:SusD/RagB family nutrient-binding outer membrane lipoprotein n=1 Tax=Rapidithrix thailandica TaxID=413964 RepID=A0AAW9RZZ6_9BACT
MMKFSSYIYKMLLGVVLLVSASCTDGFEELNRDPKNPTLTSPGVLFNGVLSKLEVTGDERYYLHHDFSFIASQLLTQTFEADAFSRNAYARGVTSIWGTYFDMLKNVREIESLLEESNLEDAVKNNRLALLKITAAYRSFVMADHFGGFPYFKAGMGFDRNAPNYRPVYDSQESIYKSLLDDLKWAVENIDENVEAYGSQETLFGNDFTKWKKWANSMRLKYALRMYEKDNATASTHIKEVMDGGLPVLEEGEDVVLTLQSVGWPDKNSWSWREHGSLRMGTNIWHKLSDTDDVDGSGIFDPRTKIWFEPNQDDEWIPLPQAYGNIREDLETGNNPYHTRRRSDYFDRGHNFTAVNFWLVEDSEYFPEILTLASDIYFVKAEIYARNIVSGGMSEAKKAYEAGIKASMNYWFNVADNIENWQTFGTGNPTYAPPSMPDATEMDAFLNHPKVMWADANALDLIYTQRWLNYMFQPWDAWSLKRRTDATPAEELGEGGERFVSTMRFPFPQDEKDNNNENWSSYANSIGGDEPSVPVWWDVN